MEDIDLVSGGISFSGCNTRERHSQANFIINNVLIVMPHMQKDAQFLKQYVEWLRSTQAIQKTFF
jgi:hypothetical protein